MDDASEMTVWTFLALIPALIGLAASQGGEQPAVRQIALQDQLITRVPVRPRLAPPAIDWTERKGPKCVPLAEIRAAMLSGPEQVDFMLTDRRRVRAQLSEGCEALDFYVSFYVKTDDDRICAERDFIHSRMGGRCEIARFRSLEPKLRR